MLNNINGILGTLIFHLLILVLFLSFKLSQNITHQELLDVKLEAEDASDLLKKMDQAEQEKTDKLNKIDLMADGMIRRNIGVNVTDKTEDEISTDKFIQQFAEQNKLEGFKRAENPQNTEEMKNENKDNNSIENTKLSDVQKPPGSKQIYKGPTNIYYDLSGRKVRYLPVPVYLCEGSGKVIIEIYINQNGEVISSSILKNQSSINDDCLYETAAYYASHTLFSEDHQAPPKQKGTITYIFVPQH